MPQTIGKYQILERIGRGGMGVVFKAYDPVLERAVAVKVISSDVEVTAEHRARFFREAQACARLSHPNIVTVYDMGEDDGRLFIVMELLDGRELRQIIGENTLPLEDKLSILGQVCDGLHYAHQKGIVHRDIKPGNIMLLPSGQLKILDFGVARIATTGQDLTRTGLVMGTLRYIAPEQVRGRVDQRSDIFSVGAVSYELLGGSPPFTGDDPLQILERLRTEDPPPLTEIDARIPSELSAIVQRAMRKDPDERFPDLGQMRRELEPVQRSLAEEARQVRARVRAKREQVRALQAALVHRVGSGGEPDVIPDAGERDALAAVQAVDAQLSDRITRLEAALVRADSHAPALRKGLALVDEGRFDDAVVVLEAIVTDMPEHARAGATLGQAREQREAQRQRQLRAELEQEARAALDDREYARCLEILERATELLHAEDAAALAPLRERAEAGRAAQEAIRRAEKTAGEAIERTMQARSAAVAVDAARHAPSAWPEAEAQWTSARAAFGRGEYADATRGLDAATATFRRAEQMSREAQLPGPDEAPSDGNTVVATAAALETQHVGGGLAPPDTLDQTVLSNEMPPPRTARAGDLTSRGVWPDEALPNRSSSRRRLVLAVAVVGGIAVIALIGLLLPARPVSISPKGGDSIARPAPRPEAPPPVADTAPPEKKAEPSEAAKPATGGEPRGPALPPREPPKSPEPPRTAAVARPSSDVEQAQARMVKARRAAEQVGASFYANRSFASAQAKEREAAAALGKTEHGLTLRLFAEAEAAYASAAETARTEAETERRMAPVKAALGEAQEKASIGRKQALTAGADRAVRDLFYAAQARHVEADDLLARQNPVAATQAFLDAADRYAVATRRAEGKPEVK